MKIADKTEFERQNIFGTGDPNVAFAQYFHGQSYLNPLTDPSRCSVFLANVTFEPICTAGSGWYQEEGKKAVSLEPGMVVTIPPEVKHWHGAKADSYFSHIAAEIPGEDCGNEWLEPVTDEEYSVL